MKLSSRKEGSLSTCSGAAVLWIEGHLQEEEESKEAAGSPRGTEHPLLGKKLQEHGPRRERETEGASTQLTAECSLEKLPGGPETSSQQ